MLHLQHVAITTYRGFMDIELQNHFTDSIFYEVELTAKYCKMLGTQLLKILMPVLLLKSFQLLIQFYATLIFAKEI